MLPQSVGVVGLGAMGLHMAKRLARRVPTTTVFDLNAGAVAAAVEGGCTAAEAATAAVGHEVVLTSLPRSSDDSGLCSQRRQRPRRPRHNTHAAAPDAPRASPQGRWAGRKHRASE